jgi:hypothetical protein
MLNARKDAANIYVFISVIPALILITFTIADNNMIIREVPEKIISKAAYTTLILITTQARSSLINLITV